MGATQKVNLKRAHFLAELLPSQTRTMAVGTFSRKISRVYQRATFQLFLRSCFAAGVYFLRSQRPRLPNGAKYHIPAVRALRYTLNNIDAGGAT
jgi:hypothetical protein